MKVITKETVIGRMKIIQATTFLSRLKGLLFTKSLESDECILISPCTSIHTIGMLYSINIIFLDKDDFVISVKNKVRPNRICLAPPKTKKVIELASKRGIIQPHIVGHKFTEDLV
ncbi:DUF192 domain-containing protein [Psychrobacter lutiphocae]|uniref:DUF192 domain-containing protein n=1 Tax=Psychrobacter lutiphocae TaxID=540500 RepID=UPI001427E9B4|nr:DUF192 domain-containing protein [Psychrobacter lutiphocae]